MTLEIIIEKDSATRIPKIVKDLEEARQFVATGFGVMVVTEDGPVPFERYEDSLAPNKESGVEKAGKPSDGLKVDQLKAALEAKGVDYPEDAKKADLAALLDSAED